MARDHIIFRSGSTVYRRRQPLLRPSPSPSSAAGSMAEVAGGTAAECVAVWCCCPCTVVNLVVLGVYKIPAGICRKALRQRRRMRLMKMGLLPRSLSSSHHHRGCGCRRWETAEIQTEDEAVSDDEAVAMVVVGESEMDKELMELEKEMWERFDSAGFWRSPSRREPN